MADVPRCVRLLNAIVNGERRGAELFECWAATSPDPDVAALMHTIALREREHAAAFEKRLCELGHGVRERDAPEHARRLRIAGSDRSDRKKLAKLGFREAPDRDDLGKLLDDPDLDPVTAALLGRFIAEERDTLRRLADCHRRLDARKARRRDPARPARIEAGSADPDAIAGLLERLAEIECRVVALEAAGLPLAAD